MARPDEDEAVVASDDRPEGIGPDPYADVAGPDWMAERCPGCGRPLPQSDEGVLVW